MTENPPPVRLSDYQPYPFRIDQVRMRFQLHPTDTRVLTAVHPPDR
jgi:aminopeptidase N